MDFTIKGAATLRAWARDGAIDAREFAQQNFVNDGTSMDIRSMGSSGSTLVPNQFHRQFFDTVAKVSQVYGAATIIRTEGGGQLSLPAADDDESGVIKAENAQATSEDAGFRSILLGAYAYTSKQLPVSIELMDDGGDDLIDQLNRIMARRCGRIMNAHFTTGTGSGQPKGLVTASTLGATTAANNAIEVEELLDAQHAVPESYQDAAAWMMSLPTLRSLRSLTDASGNLAYRDGLLLGKPVRLNGAMPSVGAGTKPVLYGDSSAYLIRQVDALEFRRFRERYAELHQVALSAVVRADGDLGDVNAVKHILMAT